MGQTLIEFKLSQRRETERLRKTKKGILINPVTGWLDSRYTDKSKLASQKRRRYNKLKKSYDDE